MTIVVYAGITALSLNLAASSIAQDRHYNCDQDWIHQVDRDRVTTSRLATWRQQRTLRYQIFWLSKGADYASGTPGGDDDTENIDGPVTTTVTAGWLGFRLTGPDLHTGVSSGAVTTYADGQLVAAGTDDMNTESGLSEVIAQRSTPYSMTMR